MGAVIPVSKPDMLAQTFREPVGVVVAITASNSPPQFLAVKCAPALAAGCAVVVKPSEFSAVNSLEFARIAQEAGLPDGVLSLVTGYGAEIRKRSIQGMRSRRGFREDQRRTSLPVASGRTRR